MTDRTRVYLRVPTETRERWERAARVKGVSLQEFVTQAGNDSSEIAELEERERQEKAELERRSREVALRNGWDVTPQEAVRTS